jgi:hypothetical protein
VVETRRNEDNMYVMNGRVFQDGYEHKRFSAKTLAHTKDPSLEEVGPVSTLLCQVLPYHSTIKRIDDVYS